MRVLMPDNYDIAFETEEINPLKDALAVINNVIKEMNALECDTLYYKDEDDFLEEEVCLSDLCTTKEVLRHLIEDTPNKMY